MAKETKQKISTWRIIKFCLPFSWKKIDYKEVLSTHKYRKINPNIYLHQDIHSRHNGSR